MTAHNTSNTLTITFAKKFALLVIALSFLCSETVFAATLPQHLKKAVQTKLTKELKAQNLVTNKRQRIAYEISRIDSRLRLANCNKPLQVNFQRKQLIGRVSAKVECLGRSPWTVHIPVDIKVFKKVVATQSPLPRNHMLSRTDLQLAEKDVTNLRNGYFISIAKLDGKQLKRSLPIHGVITPNMVVLPMAVKRGDEVMILAKKGMLTVRSPGIAMVDGRVGQQIRVRNTSSKRIVKAEIIKKGLVKILI